MPEFRVRLQMVSTIERHIEATDWEEAEKKALEEVFYSDFEDNINIQVIDSEEE